MEHHNSGPSHCCNGCSNCHLCQPSMQRKKIYCLLWSVKCLNHSQYCTGNRKWSGSTCCRTLPSVTSPARPPLACPPVTRRGWRHETRDHVAALELTLTRCCRWCSAQPPSLTHWHHWCLHTGHEPPCHETGTPRAAGQWPSLTLQKISLSNVVSVVVS